MIPRPTPFTSEVDMWMSFAGLAIGVLMSPYFAWAGWRYGCWFRGRPKYSLPFWPDEFTIFEGD